VTGTARRERGPLRSNPSIEGTPNIRLRQMSAAPPVER